MRSGFAAATAAFLAAVDAVHDDRWDVPGALGQWTPRVLVAHTLRAFTTIEAYLVEEPMVDRVLADAAEYYSTLLGAVGLHEGVDQRAREAGALLNDPVGESEATAARVSALVASTLDDDPVHSRGGTLTFIEFLATRVVELGVHTLDLQRALGEHVEVPRETGRVVLGVLVQLADPTDVILALTGRAALPTGFNVLG